MNIIDTRYKQLKHRIFDKDYKINNVNDACKIVSLYWNNDDIDITMTDALNIENQIIHQLDAIDVSGTVKMTKLIKIYYQLFYLENFINTSCIQNTRVINKYTAIKELLHIYESGKMKLKIKS